MTDLHFYMAPSLPMAGGADSRVLLRRAGLGETAYVEKRRGILDDRRSCGACVPIVCFVRDVAKSATDIYYVLGVEASVCTSAVSCLVRLP